LQMIEMIRNQMVFSPIRFDTTIVYSQHNHIYSTKSKTTSYSDSIYASIMQTVNPKYNESFIVTPKTFHNQNDLLLFRPIPIHSYYNKGFLVLQVAIEELMKFVDKLNLGYES